MEMNRFMVKSPFKLPDSININNNGKDDTLTGRLVIHYFLKALMMCLCTIGCMFQIASIIKLYFDYPTTVFVNVQNMDKLYLPGITLCNSNRLIVILS